GGLGRQWLWLYRRDAETRRKTQSGKRFGGRAWFGRGSSTFGIEGAEIAEEAEKGSKLFSRFPLRLSLRLCVSAVEGQPRWCGVSWVRRLPLGFGDWLERGGSG